MVEALTVNFDELVRQHREEITATVDVQELDRLRAEEKRLAAKKQEAIDKELEADDAADKRHYAALVAEFKGRLALLRRRIASFSAEADVIEVDTATIRRRVTLGTQTKVRSERRAILEDWIQEIRWAGDEAEITLRVPVKPVANCQHDQPHVDTYILLKTKRRIA
jgi:hypothetical protein